MLTNSSYDVHLKQVLDISAQNMKTLKCIS